MRNFHGDVTYQLLAAKPPIALLQKVKSGLTLLVTGVTLFDSDGDILYVVGSERATKELNMLR